jgi:hypothetical protein
MPKNWSIGEPQTVYQYLEDNKDKIKVGDTIEYISNNQQGYEKYKVIEEDGEKTLELIDSYDMQMARFDEEEFAGGKSRKNKRSKKSKTKRRTNKKRQNKKRKSARRKYTHD